MAQLVERWTGDQRVAGASLNASRAIVSLCKTLYLQQRRKTSPDTTEKLLTLM